MTLSIRPAAILACAVAATALSTPAAAGPLTAIVWGSVETSYDIGSPPDLFGLPNAALPTLPFIASFHYDTTPLIGQTRYISGGDDSISGDGPASPVLRASLTINGQALLSEIFVTANAAVSEQRLATYGATWHWDEGDLHHEANLSVLVRGDFVSGSLDVGYSGVGSGFGYFQLSTWNDSFSVDMATQLSLIVTSADVPEPASALVLASGLMGLALRRRRPSA